MDFTFQNASVNTVPLQKILGVEETFGESSLRNTDIGNTVINFSVHASMYEDSHMQFILCLTDQYIIALLKINRRGFME